MATLILPRRSESWLRHALGQLRAGIARTHRTPTIVLSASWLFLVVFGAIFAKVLPLAQPDAIDPFHRLTPIFSPGHLLGTDDLGRDVLARLVYGARVSLIVAVVAFAFGFVFGTIIGMICGYLGGWINDLFTWVTNVILSFPALVLLLTLVAFVGTSLFTISIVLGFLAIPIYARLTKAQTLSVSQRDFVKAARAMGVPTHRILFREILPNVLPSALSYGLIQAGQVMVVEGSLSFLGLSVTAPTPSWGGLIASGQQYLDQDAALVLVPAAVMCATVLAFNFLGDILRQHFESSGGAGL